MILNQRTEKAAKGIKSYVGKKKDPPMADLSDSCAIKALEK